MASQGSRSAASTLVGLRSPCSSTWCSVAAGRSRIVVSARRARPGSRGRPSARGAPRGSRPTTRARPSSVGSPSGGAHRVQAGADRRAGADRLRWPTRGVEAVTGPAALDQQRPPVGVVVVQEHRSVARPGAQPGRLGRRLGVRELELEHGVEAVARDGAPAPPRRCCRRARAARPPRGPTAPPPRRPAPGGARASRAPCRPPTPRRWSRASPG